MTGLKLALEDLKLVVATDRRIWSAACFILVVVTVWFATGAWREEETAPEERFTQVLVKPEKVEDLVKEFNLEVRQAKEENKYLHDAFQRMNNDIQVQKEEIDWHTDTLITRLTDMTGRVDKLTHIVGERSIERAKLEEKIKRHKKKPPQKKQLELF